MNDKELLGLAAKAAGYEIEWGIVENGRELEPPTRAFKRDKYGVRWNWNPLTDDGDALRLAVKLGVAVELHPAWVYARAVMPNDHMKWTEIVEGWGKKGEPYAATRRAIVRAAAEIGKLTPSAPSTDGGGV